MQKINSNTIIDILLTFSIAVWLYFRIIITVNDPLNGFTNQYNVKLSSGQYFMFNVIWRIEMDLYPNSNYSSSVLQIRYDYILGFVTLFVWLKLLIMFKYLKTFGIVFVIVTKCVAELTKFFALWGIEILLFTSVAFLLLG